MWGPKKSKRSLECGYV